MHSITLFLLAFTARAQPAGFETNAGSADENEAIEGVDALIERAHAGWASDTRLDEATHSKVGAMTPQVPPMSSYKSAPIVTQRVMQQPMRVAPLVANTPPAKVIPMTVMLPPVEDDIESLFKQRFGTSSAPTVVRPGSSSARLPDPAGPKKNIAPAPAAKTKTASSPAPAAPKQKIAPPAPSPPKTAAERDAERAAERAAEEAKIKAQIAGKKEREAARFAEIKRNAEAEKQELQAQKDQRRQAYAKEPVKEAQNKAAADKKRAAAEAADQQKRREFREGTRGKGGTPPRPAPAPVAVTKKAPAPVPASKKAPAPAPAAKKAPAPAPAAKKAPAPVTTAAKTAPAPVPATKKAPAPVTATKPVAKPVAKAVAKPAPAAKKKKQQAAKKDEDGPLGGLVILAGGAGAAYFAATNDLPDPTNLDKDDIARVKDVLQKPGESWGRRRGTSFASEEEDEKPKPPELLAQAHADSAASIIAVAILGLAAGSGVTNIMLRNSRRSAAAAAC